jgi:hypothetical protein
MKEFPAVSLPALADALHVTRHSVSNWILRGQFPFPVPAGTRGTDRIIPGESVWPAAVFIALASQIGPTRARLALTLFRIDAPRLVLETGPVRIVVDLATLRLMVRRAYTLPHESQKAYERRRRLERKRAATKPAYQESRA